MSHLNNQSITNSRRSPIERRRRRRWLTTTSHVALEITDGNLDMHTHRSDLIIACFIYCNLLSFS